MAPATEVPVLDAIKSFFARHGDGPGRETGDVSGRSLRIAACALLLEAAYADERFTDDERRHIEEALERHFDLSPEAARELIALADQQRREAPDLFAFASLVNSRYDEGQRMVLAEVLWRVVYADGQLSKHEDYILRKIAILLQLRPGYLAEARKRAEAGDAGAGPGGDS